MSEKNLGRIFIIFNGRFPGEQAHALFVAKSAEAFNQLGYENIIIVPNRELSLSDSKDYFKLSFSPKVVYIKIPDFAKFTILSLPIYYFANIIFNFRVRKFLNNNFKN